MRSRSGFTIIEILVVFAIIALMSVMAAIAIPRQLSRSRDATRKADLQEIKIALEDYYNDESCYPPVDSLQDCNGSDLQPYLRQIPCDPQSDEAYLYAPLANACQGYRLHAALEVVDDADIVELGCDGPAGCGYGAEWNYGVSSGVPVYDPDGQP